MSHLDNQKRDIEERWDILQLLAELGVGVKSSQTRRTNIEAHCPFHNDQGRPNLSVNINRGSRGYGCYHCFACQARGHMWTLIMEYRKCNFEEAKQWAADRCRIVLSSAPGEGQRLSERTRVQRARRLYVKWTQQELQSSFEALGYLLERGVNLETISRFQLGYCPKEGRMPESDEVKLEDYVTASVMRKFTDAERGERIRHVMRGRVTIPILAGRDVESMTGRTLDPEPPKWLDAEGTERNPEHEKYRKYYNLEGVEKCLWGLNTLLPESDIVFVGEGPFDGILSAQAGVASFALLGTDLLTVVDMLDGVLPHKTGLCLGGDDDGAGALMIERAGKLLMERGIPVSVLRDYGGASDPAEYVASHRADEWQAKVYGAEPFPVFLARKLTPETIGTDIVASKAFHPILELLTHVDYLYAMQVIEQMGAVTGAHGAPPRHLRRYFDQLLETRR